MSATNKNHDALIKRIELALRLSDSEIVSDVLDECRVALTKKYVPMTDAEWAETMREFNAPASGMNPYDADYGYYEERHIEAEVIRRAGLEVQE